MGAKLSAQPASSIVPIGEFDAKGLVGNPGGFIQLLFDASTRASKRIRPQAADFYEIMDELDAQTKASKRHWAAGTVPLATFLIILRWFLIQIA